MKLDILCPGSWMDSYESRMLGEGSWHMEVACLADMLNVIKSYFKSEQGKRSQELFHEFDLYLDSNNIGRYSHGKVTIDPIIDWIDDQRGKFRHGRQGFVLDVEGVLQYGFNKRTITLDDTHVW